MRPIELVVPLPSLITLRPLNWNKRLEVVQVTFHEVSPGSQMLMVVNSVTLCATSPRGGSPSRAVDNGCNAATSHTPGLQVAALQCCHKKPNKNAMMGNSFLSSTHNACTDAQKKKNMRRATQ